MTWCYISGEYARAFHPFPYHLDIAGLLPDQVKPTCLRYSKRTILFLIFSVHFCELSFPFLNFLKPWFFTWLSISVTGTLLCLPKLPNILFFSINLALHATLIVVLLAISDFLNFKISDFLNFKIFLWLKFSFWLKFSL